MQDLIDEYRRQLSELEKRKMQLDRLKRNLRGAPYFLLLKRIDNIKEEIVEIKCSLAWMVRQYGKEEQ